MEPIFWDQYFRKFVTCSFAFMFLVAISAYTTNLATSLTASALDDDFLASDIKDAIRKDFTCFAAPALKDHLSILFPTASIISNNKIM